MAVRFSRRRKLDNCADNVIHSSTSWSEETVVFQLLLDLGEVFLADKLTGTLTVPRKADLVIGAMLDWRIGFAAAIGVTADVVLFRESARA